MTQEVPCATWSASDVDATTIERQLSRLWTEVAQRSPDPHAVRTSIFNLVVYTQSEAQARSAARSISELAQRRPSRAIVLVGDRFQPVTSVDAELTVQCHAGPGDRALCHEQLLILVRGRAADHLASLTIPLLVPEIPTYLWWPGQPQFGHRLFHRLLGITDQLVVDSAEFPLPGDGLANLAGICSDKRGVNDLNWARIRPWREIIAQFFDPPAYRPYVGAIRSISIEFGSGSHDLRRATAGTLLLLGWIARQLGWEPETTLDDIIDRDVELSVFQGERLIPIQIRFRDHGHELAGRLCAVEIVSQPKDMPPARFVVQRIEGTDNGEVSIQIHEQQEISRILPLVGKTEEEILGDELEAAGQDTLYADVVDMASRIAGREVWVPA